MADVAETIEESGRRIGHHAWLAGQLFEIVGRWATSVPEARVRNVLAGHSHHQAWHAELWHGLLPAVPHLPAAELVVPCDVDAEIVAALRRLDPPTDPEAPPARPLPGGAAEEAVVTATVDRLTTLYRVALPHVAAACVEHLERTTVVTDGPAVRVLRLVMADLEADRLAGEALIAALAEPGG